MGAAEPRRLGGYSSPERDQVVLTGWGQVVLTGWGQVVLTGVGQVVLTGVGQVVLTGWGQVVLTGSYLRINVGISQIRGPMEIGSRLLTG